jgi:hypothetical protein
MNCLTRRVAKLERQEVARASNGPLTFRYGTVKPLPADYIGERHPVVVKQLASRSPNLEWCEMEERPGPAPESDKNIFTIRFVGMPENSLMRPESERREARKARR